MSQIKQRFKAAFDAIEAVACAQGASAGDRAQYLAQLRNRTSDHIVRLGQERERELGLNPVSQREGD